MRLPPYLEAEPRFPPFHRVRVDPPPEPPIDPIRSVEDAVRGALERMSHRPGDRVAVGVGSRGIDRIGPMVRGFCRVVADAGLRPFLLPAMGSHGGATAHGQTAVLEALGMGETATGFPVRSDMAAERIGTAMGDVPVYFAREALAAQHAVCINRVKPHTKFKAPVESGIAKMLCVGMGKHDGALSFHRWAIRYGFHPLLVEMGRIVLNRTNFRFAVAVVEDERDRVCHVEAVDSHAVPQREPFLLEMAKARFPRLPVDELDVLVVDRIGKEISGAGMDPNVTGRAFDLGESDFSGVLKARRVAVLDLTPETGGNGIGLGCADIITERAFRTLDYDKTLMNALTSLSLRKAFIPVRMPDDRKATQACFSTLGPVAPEAVRAAVIRDTRHVFDFLASPALAMELDGAEGVTVGEAAPLAFDASGRLSLPF